MSTRMTLILFSLAWGMTVNAEVSLVLYCCGSMMLAEFGFGLARVGVGNE